MRQMRNKLFVPTAAALILTGAAQAQNKVQVFILAGQSNMEGKGQVAGATIPGTLENRVVQDPANFGHLVSSGTNNWITRTDVSIASTTGPGNSIISGGLTVGFGSSSNQIGPELGFGWEMGELYGEDVLLIKTAWGGRSLLADFRPPSAVQKRGGEVGSTYTDMINVINDTLANIGTYVPGYAGQGYELKGFGWHQGFNDRINQTAVDEYEENLVDFINDVRFELKAADLPFVVANTGIGGPNESNARALQLMAAQTAVDELTGTNPQTNVRAIDTRQFWVDAADSPVPSGSQGFHWNQAGQTMYLMGEAMGEQMATMSGYVQFESQYLEVNQQTGEIKIVNPASNLGAVDLEAYAITSASGALNAANWSSIAGNYDGAGDGSVDSGNWLVNTASVNELSESAVPGGADGLIAIGSEVSLGAGAWIQNLTKDLQATYTDTDGNVEPLYILYTGDDNILADLNTDGTIDLADWSIFVSGIQADMTGLSAPQAYQLGDLDGDFDNDIDDFDLFRRAYELENPAPGAFAAMLAEASVPEPSSLALFGLGAFGLMRRRSA
ncbi:MAG: sialate O-acetylesterase [Phycisphaeraceae bacterium]